MDAKVATTPRLRRVGIEFLTTTDLAELFRCTTRAVCQMAQRGALPRPLRLTGRLMYWRRDEFLKWMEKKARSGA